MVPLGKINHGRNQQLLALHQSEHQHISKKCASIRRERILTARRPVAEKHLFNGRLRLSLKMRT
jgi:hypothetical protein